LLFSESVKGKKYICDKCKKIIPGEKLKLDSALPNISMFCPNQFIFVDKDEKIIASLIGPSAKAGDQIICCPECDHVHLFGMELAK